MRLGKSKTRITMKQTIWKVTKFHVYLSKCFRQNWFYHCFWIFLDTEIKDVKTTEDNFMIENEEGMRKRLSSTNIDKIETKRNGVEVKESTTTSDAPDTVSEFGDRILPYKWWSSGNCSIYIANLSYNETRSIIRFNYQGRVWKP